MASNRTTVKKTMAATKAFLESPKDIHDPQKVIEAITSLVNVVSLLCNQIGLNSSNSSKPPSSDLNKKKKSEVTGGKKKKPGGQKNHKGSRLEPFENPTEIHELLIDRRILPPGEWTQTGFDKRQVVDIEISFTITEYQAEVLVNESGETYVANFPDGITEPVQYGTGVKATSIYLSQFQLIPQARVQDVLATQYGLPISKGSINNFNILAARRLREWDFEAWLRGQLLSSSVLHADETGVNLNGVRHWIHCLSSESLTYFHFDTKRGTEAMDRMKVLSSYSGQLVHDHWKPYFIYLCIHVLCNAHHLRELERAIEQDGQKWAKKMKKLLIEINDEVSKAGGKLGRKEIKKYKKSFRRILAAGDIECPEDMKNRAQSKSRNLLERLTAFEDETLRFMEDELTPFTNNLGERDLRMNKVQQKISGCFRAERGAQDFCLIRSYLSTCRKQGIHPMEALRSLLEGKKPHFMKK